MDDCTRHAFTDGDCVKAGCRDCPARLGAVQPSRPDRLGAAVVFIHLVATMAAGLVLILKGLAHV